MLEKGELARDHVPQSFCERETCGRETQRLKKNAYSFFFFEKHLVGLKETAYTDWTHRSFFLKMRKKKCNYPKRNLD